MAMTEEQIHALRLRAEKLLEHSAEETTFQEAIDAVRIIHDLNVYQVELEMQNDELLRTQERLEVMHARYLELFESAPAGLLDLDESGRIVNLNLTVSTLLGHERRTMKGRLLTHYLMPGSQDTYYFHFHSLTQPGLRAHCELQFRRADGAVVVARMESAAQQRADGSMILRCSLMDLTPEQEMRAALEETQERFRLITENSEELVTVSDELGAFVYASPSMARLLGMTPEALIGRRLAEFVHESDAAVAVPAADASQAEFRLIVADGSMRWIEASRHQYTWSGATYHVTVGRDTTQRHAIMDRLAASEKRYRAIAEELQVANATKDMFFSLVAHDLKNAFFTILGFSDMLVDDDAMLTDELRSTYVLGINTASSSAHDLLQNLLDWSRMSSGRITCTPITLSLAPVVLDVLDGVHSLAAHKMITIVTDIPEGFSVRADLNMLTTIIRNLVSNALKFTERGGSIHVVAMRTGVHDSISVHDTGVGISRELLDRLTSDAERFSLKGTDQERGTGLGLILCRNFVEMHGGQLRVTSEPGKGSEFTIMLPSEPRQNGL